MARYRGPKDRLSRREEYNLFGNSKLTRLNVPPGIHGPRGTRRPSGYGKQLREKQKVKRMYGILERQFKKYVNMALKKKGNTGSELLSILERRLDNVIYRLGFTTTRNAARQLVAHGHVMVNGQKLNIPSYLVKVNDMVTISSKAAEIAHVKKLIMDKEFKTPAWLERKALAGKIVRFPKRDDVTEQITEADVIEFYSR